VFKVPRLEAHVEEGRPPTYTIVVPKYAAEARRAQATEEDLDGEQSGAILLVSSPFCPHEHGFMLPLSSEAYASLHVSDAEMGLTLEGFVAHSDALQATCACPPRDPLLLARKHVDTNAVG
jgi:hypothetical protein